jgi:AcrR family transcriptional regulator
VPPGTTDQRRVYDSSRRREQARRRRAAILDACRDELVEAGYAGTTVRAVAARAGVSQETVYKAFGTRRALVKALYDVTLAGDDDPVPLAERPAVRALLAEADPRRAVAGYAHLARQISERLGAVTAVLSAGGAEAAELTAETERERLAGTTAFVRHLTDRGHLRADVTAAAAADALWVLTSPQTYHLCTAGRGWSPDAYESWLTRMMAATLLD